MKQTELVIFKIYRECTQKALQVITPIIPHQHSKEEKVSRTCETGVKIHISESSFFCISDKHSLLSDYLRPEKDNVHPTYKVRFGRNR